MNQLKIISALVLASLLGSCTKTIIDEAGPTDPVIGPVTYNADIQAVVFNNCVTCHSGSAPSAGLDLTTYQNVKAAAENGNFLMRVEDVGNPMPPAGLLPAEQRQKIAKWAEDGFPEN